VRDADRLRVCVGGEPGVNEIKYSAESNNSCALNSLLSHYLENHKRQEKRAFILATSYGLDDREVGVQVPVGSRIFSFPNRPDRLWGPPISYPVRTGGSFPGGKAAGA
jgi:hypothetical protein